MRAQISPARPKQSSRGETCMEDEKRDFVTQEETGELPPVDEVEGRVEAEMKRIRGSARESVGQGLQDEHEGREPANLKAAVEEYIKKIDNIRKLIERD